MQKIAANVKMDRQNRRYYGTAPESLRFPQLLFAMSCSVGCDKLEEMTAENSTADESTALNTSATYDYISTTAAFFVPAQQLGNAVQFYSQYLIIGIGIF